MLDEVTLKKIISFLKMLNLSLGKKKTHRLLKELGEGDDLCVYDSSSKEVGALHYVKEYDNGSGKPGMFVVVAKSNDININLRIIASITDPNTTVFEYSIEPTEWWIRGLYGNCRILKNPGEDMAESHYLIVNTNNKRNLVGNFNRNGFPCCQLINEITGEKVEFTKCKDFKRFGDDDENLKLSYTKNRFLHDNNAVCILNKEELKKYFVTQDFLDKIDRLEPSYFEFVNNYKAAVDLLCPGFFENLIKRCYKGKDRKEIQILTEGKPQEGTGYSKTISKKG